MKKFFIALIGFFVFCNLGYAEPYYFKKCRLNEKVFANYVIDLQKNVINVNLKSLDGYEQKLEDKIKLITEDQIVSEIIQSGAGKNSYFQYYLNANSKSIIKLKYKKKNNIFVLDGKKIQSYCTNVKADWSKSNKK